ncbi:LOW QUALITY PROTEIN: hypothetical protein ACHAWF_000555, partial [Thalassiosira exigua]
MDVDENDKAKDDEAADDAKAKAKKKDTTPSASAESASPHPDMALAQDIHRLTMIECGKLSAQDATAMAECTPGSCWSGEWARGGKTLEEAIEANLVKNKPKEEGYAATTTTAKEKEREEEDAADEPLLNPSLCRHLGATLLNSSSPGAGTLSDDDLAKLDAHHDEVLKLLDDAATKAKEEAGDMEVLGVKMAVVTYRAPPWLCTRRSLRYPSSARGRSSTVRDLEGANALLAEGVATFSCSELCEYPEFVAYAIVTNLLYLKRPELKKTIVDGSEVLQVAKDIPAAIRLANTLYDCDYEAYLHALVDLHPHLVADRYLQPHAGYLLRELHVLAFRQFLDSYQSVTLDSMAKSFGV